MAKTPKLPERQTVDVVLASIKETYYAEEFVKVYMQIPTDSGVVKFRTTGWHGNQYVNTQGRIQFYITRMENDEEYNARIEAENKRKAENAEWSRQRKETALAKKMKQLEKLQKQLAKAKS
jgi:peptide subunit release factor RF-3